MEAVIKVQKLNKNYGSLTAVQDVNISVDRGEIFGLLGPNGAGKSTTMECMLGTKKPDTGEVIILGMNPITHRRQLFQKVGVQFQEASYQDKITVEELCEETACLYRKSEDYKSLLEQFGLKGKFKSFISDLSGGERQRLFIVLALIPQPEVVFLDELTTGLDVKSRREVWKHLERQKKKGLTIFLTSHFMDEVETLCDKIAILKKGRIVFYGTVQDAIKESPYESLEEAYLWFAGEDDLVENL